MNDTNNAAHPIADEFLAAQLRTAATDTLVAVAFGEGARATRAAALKAINACLYRTQTGFMASRMRTALRNNGFKA